MKGETPADVQGVNLREEIQRIAVKKPFKDNILGFVRNDKQNGLVEIICKSKKGTALVDEFYAEILKLNQENGLIKISEKNSGVITMSYSTAVKRDLLNKELKFNDFRIERNDELTEIVWALQAAGKIFQSGAK